MGAPSSAFEAESLIGRIHRFVALAWEVDCVLREFLAEHGRPEAVKTLAHAWHNYVEQIGEIPGVGSYYFHGIGCGVELGGQGTVDIDWDPAGDLIIDAYKIRRWLAGLGVDFAENEIVAGLQTLADSGAVKPTSWHAHFTVPRG